jgi:hypothetical protein
MTEPPRDRQGWIKVAGAQNESEAEFIQGLLREEGVVSILRRTRGSDVPELLAAGPRDVLVAASGADIARDVLLQGQPGQPHGGPTDASGDVKRHRDPSTHRPQERATMGNTFRRAERDDTSPAATNTDRDASRGAAGVRALERQRELAPRSSDGLDVILL